MAEEPLPQRIGKYRVLTLIGRGGMGEVYLALDLGLRRQVAIKILPSSLRDDARTKERFLREALAIAALNHPNVVTIHEVAKTGAGDVGLPPGVPYLVMEYVDGRSLGDLMGDGALPADEALRLSAQILEGLRAAHQAGLIHRDVKPSNLMVTPDGRVKILDFGLSKLLAEGAATVPAVSRLTREGTIAGTIEYLSPEQALGRPLDARSDLFSFGIVLFEMLSGAHPFPGKTATETLANLVTQPAREWPEPAGTPEPVRRIVARALEKEPANRYSSAAELLLDVETVRRELTAGTTTTTTTTAVTAGTETATAVALPSVPPAPRRRLLLALAAMVLAAVAVWLLLRPPARSGLALPRERLKPVQLTTSAGLDLFPTFASDGNAVAYASDASGAFELYVRQLAAGGGELQITSDGGWNVEPAWSPDGRSLAYASIRRRGIWIVPALGGASRRLTELGSRPAWSPDGATIAFQSDAVSDLNAGAFAALPPSTIWTVPSAGGEPSRVTRPGEPAGGHGSPAWFPDGRRIAFVTYVRPFSELWSVGPGGAEPRRISKSQPFYFDPVFAPDGRTVFFASAAKDSPSGAGLGLWRLDLDPKTGRARGEPTELLNLGLTTPRHLALSHDGRKLAYSALLTSSNLWSLVTAEPGNPPVPLTKGSARHSRPAFSPDGTRIAYTTWRTGSNNDVWMMDADGRKARQLTTDPSSEDYPSWFPDGERIAFVSTRRGPLALYWLSLKSVGEHLLADLGPGVAFARLSPDGRFIAYNSKGEGGVGNVFVSNADGTNAHPVTFDKELAGFPCWSPDGRLLAFEVKRGDDTHLAVVPRDGGTPEMITSTSGTDWPYSFSPDGRLVAFAGQRDGIWNLYTVGHASRRETPLTRNTKFTVYLRYPAFSPDGTRVVYEQAETAGNVWLIDTGKP